MKALPLVGALLLVLGILSFVVPVPQSENHGVKIGDAKISVQTESSQKLPPAVGIILLAGGVVRPDSRTPQVLVPTSDPAEASIVRIRVSHSFQGKQ